MKQATREWLKKAEADYLAALDLARRRKIPLPDQVCFHCQQCAEKYVKARLEEANVRIPKTHDLGELVKLALPFEPLWSALQPALQSLSDYAVAFRYPGHEATKAEVKIALANCKAVRKEVRLAFGLKV
ncbi:MAG: HEPN domain-containing protein [Chthoniobacteraceae bacterium]